ncbi:hypothetical protein CP965_10275 [Halarcobacter mediterraneus]|uniref:Pentapeptide repeat-containing protein n=1 Tax=Halarcobacter mediterraneus TaxID=2023153 RepID=A0A4V1M144_9BACT|nr:hypothetical protein [Halarcobacter mediterraneus]RXK12156.1 hypothetical protein CP965_10275 [Halarcobacter mediterraneus]
MPKNICSICNVEVEDKYFDKEQSKCILHSEKNDFWSNEQKYDDLFAELFIKFIKEDRFNKLKISEAISGFNYFIQEGYILFKDVIFSVNNSFLKILEVTKHKKILFENCIFFDNRFSKYTKFKDLIFRDCVFHKKDYGKESYVKSSNLYYDKMEIDNISYGGLNCRSINIDVSDSNIGTLGILNSSLFLKNTTISKNLYFLPSDENINSVKLIIKDNSFIKNSTLSVPEFISIENSTIEKEVSLKNSEILSLNIQNSTLNNGLELNNSIVKDRFSLINSKIKNKKLDLSNTSLPSNMNFLNAKLEVENRETARIIKDSFDRQNNFIEANNYYAIEMKHYDNELNWKDNLKEKLIFKFHDWSSEHSQNWVLALFLILLFSMGHGVIEYLFLDGNKLVDKSLSANILGILFIFLSTPFIIDNILENRGFKKYFSSFIFLTIGFYLYITNDLLLELAAKAINPFSIMCDGDSINGIELIFKIIISYLIYQLIISIRQNTRRK